MVTVCPNCGFTKNLPGAVVCSICSHSLSNLKKPQVGLNAPSFLSNKIGGRKYLLSSSTQMMIGSRGCAILLSGTGVEAQHAKLIPSGGGFLIEPVMGIVVLNGKTISSVTPMPTGSVIKIGSQTLTYTGPSAVATSPALPSPKGLTPKPVPKIYLPTINLKPVWNFFKSITNPSPALEGHITIVDGPYMEQPDLDLVGLFFRFIMGLILLPIVIVFMIFMPNITIPLLLYGIRPGSPPQIPARYLRVQDAIGKQHIVKMKGDIMWGMLSQGDDAQFWGRWQSGNLIMDRALNKATKSQVMLRTVFQRRIYWAALLLFFTCSLLNGILSVLAGY